jgi:hypothetical protein
MLQAHSLLWHYLWIGPNALLLIFAAILWRRGLYRIYPSFFAFAILSSLGEFTVYVADLASSVTPEVWWRVFWAVLGIEGLLKFALIAEIFGKVVDSYSAIAKLGKFLIRAVGGALVLAAALLAALAPNDSRFGIINGAHLLQQAVYLLETGLLAFIFVFSWYFGVRMGRPIFGISIGLAISACVQLATWAIAANGVLPPTNRTVLDFVNMATYNGCVLIWFYYLLVHQNIVVKPLLPPADSNLDLWNRELERLLQ